MKHGWKERFVVLGLLAMVPHAALADTPQRTHEITVDDYLSVYLVTDCAASPDGKHVAFAELRWWEHDESRATDLWVVTTEQPRPQRLTFDRVSARSPQWAPDGVHLYYLSRRDRGDDKPPYDGTNQVWAISTHPGEPFPITRVGGGIRGYQLSKDGRTLYYTKSGEKGEQQWKELRGKYPDIKFGDGTVEFTELWKLDLEAWREEQVVAPQRVILGFDVAPDESRIALITAPDARLITREGRSQADVFDVKTGETTTLPDRLYRAAAPSPFGWLENPAWSPDGRKLAFTVSYDGYPAEILVAEWPGGEPQVRMLTRPDEVHVASHLEWIPGTSDLCFLADSRARKHVYCVTVADNGKQGRARNLTPGDVVVHGYSFTADGKRMAVIKSNTRHCRDVFWLEPGQPETKWTRLSKANPQMDTWKLPQVSHITWTAPDGSEVGGILELPPDYTTDQGPLPTVIELHGGPTGATMLHLRFWIYGRTILAAKGYALLSPNYRGSTGYGDKFLADLIGHENDLDVKDILAGVDALVERGIADPQRLGVMGWSNGGFLTNCLITTTQRFKAASTGAGTIDQLMQWGIEDTPGHVINYMRGLPWERTEAYLESSPAYNIGRVTTPTLIHVGEEDPRVPAAHSLTLYRGLKEYTDVPTALLVYPGAGHGLTVSDHRKGKLEWDLAWFERYLLGKTGDADQE